MVSPEPSPALRPLPDSTVAILGLGLMGGSLGQALRARRAVHEVVGWNRGELGLREAVERGAVDRAERTLEDAVRGAHLVVICVPVEATEPLARAFAPHLSTGAVVTDVGSVKARLVAGVEAVLGARFVGGHPMAGSEESGVRAASPSLYEGAAWLLTPTAATDPGAAATVTALAAAVGATPRICEPEEHDRLVAALSHLPHLAAYGVAEAAGTVGDMWTDVAAGSYRDTTRVALSDPRLWTGILLDNRQAAGQSLDRLLGWLQAARDALARADAAALGDLLEQAHAARRRFPR